MENTFDFDTWFEDVGISNADHKLTVKNWLKEEALDTYEALKNFKPSTQCPTTPDFKVGWKNALQSSLDTAFPICKAFSQQLSHISHSNKIDLITLTCYTCLTIQSQMYLHVMKFLSHNDFCVCLSIVLYLLTPHSYYPHLSDPTH